MKVDFKEKNAIGFKALQFNLGFLAFRFELGIVGELRTSNCSFGAPDIINEIETAGLQVEPDVDRVMGLRCDAPATI
ncbi:hypothetical protein AAC387_Pa02g4722 [Persea americana]